MHGDLILFLPKAAGEVRAVTSKRGTGERRIAVSVLGEIKLIPLDSIDWIEAAGHYVRLHCQPQKYLLRAKISDVAAVFDQSVFLRISRSAIVRIGSIEHIGRRGRGDHVVRLMSGTEVRIGRTYRANFLNRFQIE